MHKTHEAQFLKKIFLASANRHKIGRLKNYQSGRNLKKGEVNFERGGIPTPGTL